MSDILFLFSICLISCSYISRGEDGRWALKTEDGDELHLDIDDEVSKAIYLFNPKQLLFHIITNHKKGL